MALFENHAGLNLTADKLQLVEVIHKENSFFLENVDEVKLDGFDEGTEVAEIINILQNSFQKIISRKPLLSRNVSFSLGHEFFKIAQIPYESTLLKLDLLDYLKYEFDVLFPACRRDDYILRHFEVNREGIINNNTVILVAVKRKMVQIIHQFCRNNNLILKNIDNVHIASNSFILLDNIGSRKEIYCSILVDGDYLSIIGLDEKHPMYFRVRKIKDHDNMTAQMVEELDHLIQVGVSTRSISKCYVGGDLADDKFMKMFRDNFDINLIRYNPLDKTRVSPHLFESDLFKENYHCFTAASGMALRMI
ncbi:MAG: hypothetical protein KKA84_02130 [Bacteroidetes bacterium]|nr:hypothetical protein [Bacteroidota bacterium]